MSSIICLYVLSFLCGLIVYVRPTPFPRVCSASDVCSLSKVLAYCELDVERRTASDLRSVSVEKSLELF